MEISIDELKHIQRIELKLLIRFDEYCRTHQIQYFLGGGTLLGAVRHNGFIPWDDDVDVMMTRENYDKLCSLWEQEFDDGIYFFQTSHTDPSYHDHMAKLRLKNTLYETYNNLKFPQMQKGFFVDIFPHDKTVESNFVQHLHIFFTKLARSMILHKWFNTPMQYYGRHKVACKIMTGFIRLVPISFLEWIHYKVTTLFDNKPRKYLHDGYGEHIDHGAFDKTILDESILIEFEGYKFPVPKRYDEYLIFSYGRSYMKLPPAEEQVPHHCIANIDFGKY